jgi:hypothetical protein
MTGMTQTGAQIQLNAVTGAAVPIVGGSAPASIPGLYWVDSGTVKSWNGSAWVAAVNPYMVLLTADPTGLVNISDLSEVTDSGYARVQTTFSPATGAYPAVALNASLITFGPFTVNMSIPAQWLALVSVSTGTTGLLLNTWTISVPQQVSATQTIDIAAGALSITQS